jgi:CMP-N-acetylneuraminic acid synthetase
MSPRIAALVPLRHHSQRVPGKNYRPFAGRALYHHVIEALLACKSIAEVAIDTDSPVIIEDAARHFPQVRLIQRPQNLRDDSVPMNDVLLYDITQIQADYYLQTHSTNPLLRCETLTRAVELFLKNCVHYDSLFSVTAVRKRLWDGLARAINHNPAILLQTQDLPPVYEENSCIYIFSRIVLETQHYRIGQRPLMFEIEPMEAWDIDDEPDFHIAEILCNRQKEQR